jgi:hypothetical protein
MFVSDAICGASAFHAGPSPPKIFRRSSSLILVMPAGA